MRRQSNGLPIELVHEFWARVEAQLRTEYGVQQARALRAILRYRNEIERVGSIVYHRNPEDVASDIISGGHAQAKRMAG